VTGEHFKNSTLLANNCYSFHTSKPKRQRSAPQPVIQGAEIVELIVDGGEPAKNLNRSGMATASDD
jgi:hypothetical protein